MTELEAPAGLGAGGRTLWHGIADAHDLDVAQLVTLHEACRAKDRLDRLDVMVRAGSSSWGHVGPVTLTLDPERLVNSTADLMKQLLASLRLPDRDGRRPQRRGTSRGAYLPRKGTR